MAGEGREEGGGGGETSTANAHTATHHTTLHYIASHCNPLQQRTAEESPQVLLRVASGPVVSRMALDQESREEFQVQDSGGRMLGNLDVDQRGRGDTLGETTTATTYNATHHTALQHTQQDSEGAMSNMLEVDHSDTEMDTFYEDHGERFLEDENAEVLQLSPVIETPRSPSLDTMRSRSPRSDAMEQTPRTKVDKYGYV